VPRESIIDIGAGIEGPPNRGDYMAE
jgi:hypothetical protein